MIISGASRVYGMYQPTGQKNTDRVSKEEERRNETLSLSPQAKDFVAVKNALSKTPDVREEKVADIAKRMKAGTYVFSAADIAEKIIKNY